MLLEYALPVAIIVCALLCVGEAYDERDIPWHTGGFLALLLLIFVVFR